MNWTERHYPLLSIDDIKYANHDVGHHYFDKSTMRFFRSRTCQEVAPLPNNGALFITSEQFVASDGYKAPRKYTIRYANPNGEIESVGDFQAFDTRAQAIAMMHRFAEWLRQS